MVRGTYQASMRKNVDLRPAGEVQLRASGEETEALGGELRAAFAREHHIEFFAQAVEVAHVGRRIFLLLGGKCRLAPVARLLLFRNFLPQQITADILKPVAVRKGARQARGDFGAIDRRGGNAQIMLEDRHIEPREMEEFYSAGVAEQLHQIRRIECTGEKLHEMLIPLAIRQLHEAEPVALVV